MKYQNITLNLPPELHMVYGTHLIMDEYLSFHQQTSINNIGNAIARALYTEYQKHIPDGISFQQFTQMELPYSIIKTLKHPIEDHRFVQKYPNGNLIIGPMRKYDEYPEDEYLEVMRSQHACIILGAVLTAAHYISTDIMTYEPPYDLYLNFVEQIMNQISKQTGDQNEL